MSDQEDRELRELKFSVWQACDDPKWGDMLDPILRPLLQAKREGDELAALAGSAICLATFNTLAGERPAEKPDHALTQAVWQLVEDRDSFRAKLSAAEERARKAEEIARLWFEKWTATVDTMTSVSGKLAQANAEKEDFRQALSDALGSAVSVALGIEHHTLCAPETLCCRCRMDEANARVQELVRYVRDLIDAHVTDHDHPCPMGECDWRELLDGAARAIGLSDAALSRPEARTPVVVEIDPADIARVYEPGACGHPEECPACRQESDGLREAGVTDEAILSVPARGSCGHEPDVSTLIVEAPKP